MDARYNALGQPTSPSSNRREGIDLLCDLLQALRLECGNSKLELRHHSGHTAPVDETEG